MNYASTYNFSTSFSAGALFVGLLLFPSVSHAALLYLDPVGGEYGLGDTFILSVRVDNEHECINAADVEVRYPPEILRAVDVTRGGSIFTLWVEEPVIDQELGLVTFSGGIPGGYCGRIDGDPILTNTLGKIVFTAIGETENPIGVRITPLSDVYLHDGLGTRAETKVAESNFTVLPYSLQTENPWLKEVHEDGIPPDPFDVTVESTEGVFGGLYYIVFSTVDKQSGLSHYEIFERGFWKRIASPYRLKDQSLRNGVQLRAVDKAGNVRLADFDTEAPLPERVAPPSYANAIVLGVLFALILLAGLTHMVLRRMRKKAQRS